MGSGHLGDLSVDGRIILKWILNMFSLELSSPG
jgi:hypothetical protein